MTTYVDHNGILWNIEPPGTEILLIQDDGAYKPGPSPNWVAYVTSDAYGHVSGSMLAVATDGRDIRSVIDSYVLAAGKPDAPTNINPPAKGSSSSWLFALILGGFYYLSKKTKGRR